MYKSSWFSILAIIVFWFQTSPQFVFGQDEAPQNEKITSDLLVAMHNGAVARGHNGTSFYFLVQDGQATLYLGKPDADSLAVQLDQGTPLVGPQQGLISSGTAEQGVALFVTKDDHLFLAWSEQGTTYSSVCELKQNSSRALVRENFTTPVEIGVGYPTSAAWNTRDSQPVITGYSPENRGTIWAATFQGDRWNYESVVADQGETVPQTCVSPLGIVHVVWRDETDDVWHLENKHFGEKESQWMQSGGTSNQPEKIGHSVGVPSVAAVRHQLLIALTTKAGQIESSLYTGQSWEKNQPCTIPDERWKNDNLSKPKIVVDGLGVPWLFFVNSTGKREYLYYTRWLGFSWDTIREGRGIFHVSEKFLDCLAPIEFYFVPSHVLRGDREISLLLVNHSIPKPLHPERFDTPSPAAKAGNDILFLDMLDVGRSYWTEQVLQPAEKHPDNPLLKSSGDPNSLDSHRVFNGGVVLKEGNEYKAWYTAMNPIGDWHKDGKPTWKKMIHMCYATSPDGISWQKPNLGIHEFKGNKNNNGLGLSIDFSSELRHYHGAVRVMLNPDQNNPDRKFLSVPPGYSSADGLHWKTEAVTFNRPGPDPKWVDFHSVIYDPDAPASRRWKIYGCTCTNEPPVLRSICYAYSADGVNWTEDPENPIMLAETGGFWNKVHDVATCKYKDHYMMLYQTGNGYDQHLELATSRDGRHFVRVHDGQSIIKQGQGDAFDRGLFLPADPVVLENEIRLYYGAADYHSPSDPPFEYERWKKCKLQMGLATLPIDGWTYIKNIDSKHVGYVTTVPVLKENLEDCVLSLNVQCKDKGQFLVELLDADTDARIPGYEMENCDHINQSGTKQVVSWKGKSGLENVSRKKFRIRVIFIGRGDAARLYSIGFRKDETETAPVAQKTDASLVEESLEYRSSVSNLSPLKSWTAHRPDGKRKPVVVLMHGFGERIYRHGGQRMAGSVRYYARKGLVAIGVDLRGREESTGQRDNGGLEVMDIYDAIQATLKKYPEETDPENINIIGWSGGGGNTFSAVTRMPDLFSNAAAFYGITDYGHWANTAFKGAIEADIGGTPKQVPNRYAARNSLLGVGNNAYTNFQFFWDEDETICPVWMDEEYRRLAEELKYDNITPHESKRTDKFRWLHAGGDRPSAVEAERLTMPLFLERNNPSPRLKPIGKMKILGYLMTKRFQTLFGQGNDTVVDLDYELKEEIYEFNFKLDSTDPSVRGWLKITDRQANEVKQITMDGKNHSWETTQSGHILIRNISPESTLVIQFQ